jgi:hypothetical protein
LSGVSVPDLRTTDWPLGVRRSESALPKAPVPPRGAGRAEVTTVELSEVLTAVGIDGQVVDGASNSEVSTQVLSAK